MTRFVLDARAVIHLVAEEIRVAPAHHLLAPTLLRSEVLSFTHEAVSRGEITAQVGRERIARAGKLDMRYLGDAVLRRVAWDLAEELGQASTFATEYLALTRLQADALVALDPEIARLAEGVVEVGTIDNLR